MSRPGHDPDRRRFLALSGLTAVAAAACGDDGDSDVLKPCGDSPATGDAVAAARVTLAKTGSPERNAQATLDAWGGVESLIGRDDVVVLKPNSQWYAQGMTNTDVLVALIEAILARPGGFAGEVIVADNHHFRDDDARGWTTETPNGRFNLNGVVGFFRARGETRVGKAHWHDAGPNPEPWQFDAGWGNKVLAPGAGDGYRWQLDQCHVTEAGNKCAMTWPVFTSPVSGDVIDLKDGVFHAGKLSGRPLRLINVSSINYHSRYGGVTAAVKNHMGIVDMTCGFHGPEPEGFCNTHYIGLKSSHSLWRWADKRMSPIRRLVHRVLPEEDALDFHHTGGALGHWMRTVRMPDLHIVTAEWIGWGSRTHPDLCARPGMTLASKNPVTVDAAAAREALLPATVAAGAAGKTFLSYNDVDNHEGPFRRFLEATRREIGGTLEPGGAQLVRLS
jgi:uncharacterized protein (DUF362 family)